MEVEGPFALEVRDRYGEARERGLVTVYTASGKRGYVYSITFL